MLKTKEKRDTAVLLAMGIVILGFLLYVFIPSRDDDKTTAEKENKKGIYSKKYNGSKSKSKTTIPQVLPDEPSETSILDNLNQRIETELNTIFKNIVESENPFDNTNIEGLANLPGEFNNKLVDKLYKFSFSDLNDIPSIQFPSTYSDRLKFNLYLSLFLLKIKEEGIEKKINELPGNEFENAMQLDCYKLLGNEIETDYELIPILFYFKCAVQHLTLFPSDDETLYFKKKIKHLRDLTPGKWLIEIRDLLVFSKKTGRYRISWREHDPIGSDDKENYGNLPIGTIDFLKQVFVIFPDEERNENNKWIKDLCDSDNAGDIELTELDIQGEDPSRHSKVEKIVYNLQNSRFVAIFKSYNPVPHNSESMDITSIASAFINRLLARRWTDFYKYFTVVDFNSPDTLSASLDKFGSYLKRTARL